MYKLCFYVPASHLQQVKEAVFGTGAGRIGNYDHCCWQVLGDGQFRPLSGSQPFIGDQEQIQQVAEYRVELVCEDSIIHHAVAEMITAHPYEEPAYDVLKLEQLDL